MRKIAILFAFLSVSCAVRAQQFDVPAGTVSLEPLGASAGETGRAQWYELVANGRERVTLKAPDSLSASLGLTWFSALPGGSAVAICVDSTGLLTTGCSAGGSSSGVVNSIQLSDGSGGFSSASDFVFDGATHVLYAPGDIDTFTHQEFTLTVADSGFFSRRALWIDSADNMTIGLENALGGNLKLRAGLGPSSKYTLTMPMTAPPDSGGNNFLKYSSSGVGSWDSIAAFDVWENSTPLTPRGALNFLTTITASDALSRTDIEVNMAANYIWTGLQSFDTNLQAFSTSRHVTGFGRIEGWTNMATPSLYWSLNPASPTSTNYWLSSISGTTLNWTANGATKASWTSSTFSWNGNMTPVSAGSGEVGTAGAPWDAGNIENLTVGSTIGAGNLYIRTTSGGRMKLSTNGSSLYLDNPDSSSNYGFYLLDPTGSLVNTLGLYTETVSGSNERGVVGVAQEGSSNIAELRPTSLTIKGQTIDIGTWSSTDALQVDNFAIKSSGNFYTRDIGGASTGLSCSGVSNGWFGVSSDNYAVFCYGGSRYRVALSSY